MNPEQKQILVTRADELFIPACERRLTAKRILDALVLTFEEGEKPLLEEILALRLCLTEYNKLKLSQNTLRASLTEAEQALRIVTSVRDGLREAASKWLLVNREVNKLPTGNFYLPETMDGFLTNALAKLSNETTNQKAGDTEMHDTVTPLTSGRNVPAESPAATHELKTDSDVFQAVQSRKKTFEIRFDDRGFQLGDVLNLKETKSTGSEMKSGAPLVYTGNAISVIVKHILKGPIYGLREGWVIMSIEIAARAAKEQS